ncbi:hypothetical protein HMPREF0083_03743 [Aneurinibacillus aneurinilyticus ATCC 12856]|jgi:hypothetical protein|uniref:Uncharacterized protein n=1 Tax=Aneurinibacillus aneurinilyticus ATCC 12856 TaxID=649747 RepID=U1X0X9_ANEAE|nr:hypothetical protein HMPREF0083_03743 [Aneurinibacillus aneurinilyticus ATCC 12856]
MCPFGLPFLSKTDTMAAKDKQGAHRNIHIVNKETNDSVMRPSYLTLSLNEEVPRLWKPEDLTRKFTDAC